MADKLEIKVLVDPVAEEDELAAALKKMLYARLEKTLGAKADKFATELAKSLGRPAREDDKSFSLDFAEALYIILQRQLTKPAPEAQAKTMETLLAEVLQHYTAKIERIGKSSGENQEEAGKALQKLSKYLKNLEVELSYSEALNAAYERIKLLGRKAKGWVATSSARAEIHPRFDQIYWERQFVEAVAAELAAQAREESGK